VESRTPRALLRTVEVDGDGLATVHLHGVLDMGTAEEAMDLAAGASPMRLDLTQVGFIDSMGVGALIRLHQVARRRGDRLQLVGVSSRVRRVIAHFGLDRVFGLT
jgi:anti-sigma B factor antagonist